MPIPEPSAHLASTLYVSGPDGQLKPATKEQRSQEMAAVYGVPMATTPFTQGEIERMRQLVNQHDSQTKNSMLVMDPNNPPKEPYRHQKFPMLVYHHEQSAAAYDKTEGVKVGNIVTEQKVHVPAKHVTRLVKNETELGKAIRAGFKETPPEFAHPEPEEDEAQG